MVEADEYAKDLRVCFTLIHRIVTVEMGRQDEEEQQKLFAAGTMDDVQLPISLLETESELLQLSGICEDAEIYPELADELRKTPAIEKRSRAWNTVLMQEGYQPVFMVMDDQMQLMAGNALMRAMVQQANPDDWEFDGLKRVYGLIETGRSLSEYGLLTSGLKALQALWEKPVVLLKELLSSPDSTPLKLVQNNG